MKNNLWMENQTYYKH